MSKETGGQAFPCLERNGNGLDLTDAGMTLRDYFAAKAMQGLIGCPDWRESMDEHNASDFTAFSAYVMADAMLKARKK